MVTDGCGVTPLDPNSVFYQSPLRDTIVIPAGVPGVASFKYHMGTNPDQSLQIDDDPVLPTGITLHQINIVKIMQMEQLQSP